MTNSATFKKLLFEHEVLWARYNIRDHSINNIVHEVYQNIGQILSLIRVQLDLLPHAINSSRTSVADPGNLLAAVIKEFREMCKGFYPEKEFLGKLGLIKTLAHELTALGFKQGRGIVVKGLSVQLPQGIELVIFRMLQEILLSIQKNYFGTMVAIRVIYEANAIAFLLRYAGKPVEWENTASSGEDLSLPRLTLLERAELIGATFDVSASKSTTTIKLTLIYPPVATGLAAGDLLSEK